MPLPERTPAGAGHFPDGSAPAGLGRAIRAYRSYGTHVYTAPGAPGWQKTICGQHHRVADIGATTDELTCSWCGEAIRVETQLRGGSWWPV